MPLQQTPPPPAAPAAPPVPATPSVGVQVITTQGTASATAVYQGLRAQREELHNQLETLEDRRRDLSQRLQEPDVGGVNRTGIEARIAEIDQRISTVDKQIAENELNIARAAAVPGAVQKEREPQPQRPPEEVFVLGGMFIVVVLLPLSIALARRLWRRGVATITSLPAELAERLTRLEQGMDAIAVEVERIGEGQRYMTRMFAEDGSARALGAGAAEPVPVKARDAEGQYRR